MGAAKKLLSSHQRLKKRVTPYRRPTISDLRRVTSSRVTSSNWAMFLDFCFVKSRFELVTLELVTLLRSLMDCTNLMDPSLTDKSKCAA